MITNITLDSGLTSKIYGEVFATTFTKEDEEFHLDIFLDFKNQRLKVLDYRGKNFQGMGSYLKYIAQENNFSKILFNIKESDWMQNNLPGFEPEARIPTFFSGEPGLMLSNFLNIERRTTTLADQENEIIKKLNKVEVEENVGCAHDYQVRICTLEDVEQLAELYAEVFSTYPTPLDSENYVKHVMRDNVIFLGVFQGLRLISAASGEMDRKIKAAEMTDCATLPEFRGKGLMQLLINLLQNEMKKREIVTLYTLARASSIGMNKVFKKAGYSYCGRMVNNCHICGRYEDMNVWSRLV